MGNAVVAIRGAPARASVMARLGVPLALLALPLIPFSPMLAPGLPNTGDGMLHIYRAVQLAASLREGDLYPRWAPDFAQGLGYPIFNFYAPLTYYLLDGLHWLGLTFVAAFKALYFLDFLACGVGMYLFARESLGVRGGLLAAAAYVYTPYRFVDAYVRGDAAEFIALAFLPWVLWAFAGVVRAPGAGRVALASLLYAGLVLSHNVTALVFTPLLLAYLAFAVVRSRAWRAVPFLAAGLALAAALSAFYWLPALGERGWVQIERALTPPTFDLHSHFVSLQDLVGVQLPIDRRLADIGIPTRLGTQLLLLGVGGLASSLLWRRAQAWGQAAFFALATVVVAFLMTSASVRLWDAVPLANYVQFPWRLLGQAGLGLAFVVGAAGLALGTDGNGRRRWPPWLAAIGSVVLLAAIVLPPTVLLYPVERDQPPANPTIADALAFERTSGAIGTSGGEYLPTSVEYLPDPSPMRALYDAGGPLERLNRPTLPAGVEAEALSHRGDYEAYRFRASQPVTVLFNLLYFPSWHAYVDGREVPTAAYKPYGMLTFTVPAGERLVELRREDTPLAKVGNAISLAAALTVLLLVLVGRRLRRRRGPTAAAGITLGAGYLDAWAIGLAILVLAAAKGLYVDDHTTWFRAATPAGVAVGAQNQLAVNLGDDVTCLGYVLDTRQVKPGGTVRLRLYWEARRQMQTDYSVFVHVVVDPSQPPVAQNDSLHPANIPTSRWAPGKYLADLHEIPIPAGLAPGDYQLIVGLYDPRPGGKRLAVSGQGEVRDYLSLGELAVRP